MRAFLVSVDYSDLLAVTLPLNRKHFDEVTVVTSSKDAPNVQPICEAFDAHAVVTDLFYADGAVFNKWSALEYALDTVGRHGWICLMDADVIWPQVLPAFPRVCGKLYSPLRRMMEKVPTPLTVPPERHWDRFPIHRNIAEWAGYSQIFHGDDPALGPAPWHEIDWKHAGGADSFFQMKWKTEDKVRPPFEVLHLGPAGVNWCGRSSQYLDGTVPDGSVAKREQVRDFIRGRTRGPDRFRHEKL